MPSLVGSDFGITFFNLSRCERLTSEDRAAASLAALWCFREEAVARRLSEAIDRGDWVEFDLAAASACEISKDRPFGAPTRKGDEHRFEVNGIIFYVHT